MARYKCICYYYYYYYYPSDPVHDILPADWDWNKCPCSLTHAHFISFSCATKPQPGKGLNTNCTPFLGYPRGRLPLFIIVNLLAGDINLNPGPDATYYPKPRRGSKPKWPCGLCNLAVKSNCIQCDYCDSWFHNKCSAASNDTLAYHFEHLSAVWICPACEFVNLTDSTSFVSDAPSLVLSNSFDSLSSLDDSDIPDSPKPTGFSKHGSPPRISPLKLIKLSGSRWKCEKKQLACHVTMTLSLPLPYGTSLVFRK